MRMTPQLPPRLHSFPHTPRTPQDPETQNLPDGRPELQAQEGGGDADLQRDGGTASGAAGSTSPKVKGLFCTANEDTPIWISIANLASATKSFDDDISVSASSFVPVSTSSSDSSAPALADRVAVNRALAMEKLSNSAKTRGTGDGAAAGAGGDTGVLRVVLHA